MTIIALSGKKKTGKNTIAKLIATLTPLKVVEIAFANPLKQEVAKACGVSVSYIDEHKDNFRLMLQGWGTDYKRKLVDKEYWVKKINSQIATMLMDDYVDVIIVTDVRFVNEYNYLANLGAVMVSVSRPITGCDDHVSEKALDNIKEWHHIILNTTSIDDLIPQVKELMVKAQITIK